MTRICAMVGLLIAASSSTAVSADTGSGVRYGLEMAGHRALERMRKDNTPDPFTTDGCSGGMSAVWQIVARSFPGFEATHGTVPPWQGCCVSHDRTYHSAGPDPDPLSSFAARLTADETLRDCVQTRAQARLGDLAVAYGVSEEDVLTGYRLISEAMFTAVRAGGAPCSGLSWRWGYGYPSCTPSAGDFRDEGTAD